MEKKQDKRQDRRQTRKPEKKFDEVLLEVRRVTRVTTGWRQMSFRATMLVWNKKGKVGIGSAKGSDVLSAIKKATHEAYKNVADVVVTENGSVPYARVIKYKSAMVKILFKISFVLNEFTFILEFTGSNIESLCSNKASFIIFL